MPNRSWLLPVLIITILAVHSPAATIVSTFAGLEGSSHFDPDLCKCAQSSGTSSASLTYATTGLGGVGTYNGSASAASSFGALSLYGNFQISDFPAGSNVSLSSSTTGRGLWVNNPFFAVADYSSTATIVGPNPTYDLTLPIYLSGSFVQAGPGLQLQYFISVGSPGHGGRSFLQFDSSDFEPGWHNMVLRGLPSNTSFDLKWHSQGWAQITDEEWFTDTPWVNGMHVADIHVTSIVNHLSGSYSSSGTVDFAHTATFGQYSLTLPDGSPAIGASLNSGGDPAYSATPEPATFLLVPAGLALLCARRRKTRT